jgi:integral membrane protein
MAFIVGTALICLTIVIIFQAFGEHVKLAEEIVAPIHGYLYLIYLVTAADLARRAHWKLGRILIVVAAGFVPTLAFIVEHRVYQQMQSEFAAEAEAEAGSVAGSEGGAAVSADAGTERAPAVSSGAGSEPADGRGTPDDGPAGRPA